MSSKCRCVLSVVVSSLGMSDVKSKDIDSVSSLRLVLDDVRLCLSVVVVIWMLWLLHLEHQM